MTVRQIRIGLVAVGLAASACVGTQKAKMEVAPAADESPAAPVAEAKHESSPSETQPDTSACDGGTAETVEELFEDGKPKARSEIVKLNDGTVIRHGTTTLFWENGGKKTQYEMVCGVRHGPKRSWHANGEKWQEGEYVNNRDHGTWTEWFADGTLASRRSMVHGSWHGTFTTWYPNGQKRTEVEWVHGKRQGLEKLWDEGGNVGRTVVYVDNVPQPGSLP